MPNKPPVDEVIFEIRSREAIWTSLGSVVVFLGFLGLMLFAISPIVLRPVVILATGALFVVSVRRSLRITFVVTDAGVYAANFFRERYATWDTIVGIKQARLSSPAYWPVFFSLALVIRRDDGSNETFVTSAGLLGLDRYDGLFGLGRKDKHIEMLDEVRLHMTAHGVPWLGGGPNYRLGGFVVLVMFALAAVGSFVLAVLQVAGGRGAQDKDVVSTSTTLAPWDLSDWTGVLDEDSRNGRLRRDRP